MDIGRVIRALRQEKGQTLEQIALAIGTDPSNLSRIERGVQQPAASSLRTIAAALGTTVAALHVRAEDVGHAPKKKRDMFGADEADYTSESIQLRRNFRTLTPENKRLVVDFVKLLNRTQNRQ
ncbi:MAG: helix-turn-helix transcriptional regulator [Thiothrix sp.]|uniref:helix-turn-helix domain-containing protein n=1 Tax=Thiothrix sp. TaxID=1032 RepID=UPI002606DF92|nr:helix-turn-helix transcriptional regulator [Thiothrix sp.]MDD5395559.1 helix-turn-helix transcriptional regulator [Thiothrix sp.]